GGTGQGAGERLHVELQRLDVDLVAAERAPVCPRNDRRIERLPDRPGPGDVGPLSNPARTEQLGERRGGGWVLFEQPFDFEGKLPPQPIVFGNAGERVRRFLDVAVRGLLAARASPDALGRLPRVLADLFDRSVRRLAAFVQEERQGGREGGDGLGGERGKVHRVGLSERNGSSLTGSSCAFGGILVRGRGRRDKRRRKCSTRYF